LNDDLVVPEGYLETLNSIAQAHPETLIGSVGVDICAPDTTGPRGVGVIYPSRWISKGIAISPGRRLDSFSPGAFDDTAMLSGRGTLIPTHVFREIGLYNRKHYTFIGDSEFPVRAKRAGYRLIVAYDAVLYLHSPRTGHISQQESYRLRDVKDYFFRIKSYTNLRARFWLAMDTRDSIVQGLSFFLTDLAKMCYHFARKVKSF
jgi:GT2 family glycosyltransferase